MVFDLDAEKINPLMALSPPDCEPTLLSLRVKAPSVFAFNVRKARLTLPEISGNPAPLCAPATKLSPGAQFRKDLRHPQKPSSGRRLRRGQRFFRNWGLVGEAEAGTHNHAGIPNATGAFPSGGYLDSGYVTGVFFTSSSNNRPDGGNKATKNIAIDLSRASDVYGGSDTVMPSSINQPSILYLGRPA